MNEKTTNSPALPPAHRQSVRRSGVGTGTTSLLMIFTVLCFATLAMLSLSTAASNERIQTRGIFGAQSAAAARGVAAEYTAALDEELLALRQSTPASEEVFFAKAEDLAENMGWSVSREDHTVTLQLPVNDTSILVTTLRICSLQEEMRYESMLQQTAPKDGWQADGGGNLWIPA